MKKLVALIMLAFIGYQCINSMHPSRKRAAESQEEANKRARTATVTLLTSDGHEISVPRKLAEKSSFIKNIIEDLGDSDEPIPLPRIDKAEITPIIAMLDALNSADQMYIKPNGDRYIPQRIQPIITSTCKSLSEELLASTIMAAHALDLDYLTNGIIRYLAETYRNVAVTDFLSDVWAENYLPISDYLMPVIEYQFQLVKNDNTPELSIADYSAIHGMPRIRFDDLDLTNKHLTSIEGLLQIPGIENLDRIFLENNKIVQLPANTFQRLTNLRRIDLDKNLLTELPATLFQGLARLDYISIASNLLTAVPESLFRGLTSLRSVYLKENRLRELPANLFQDCQNLRSLNLMYNQLTALPATLFRGLTNLTTIYLSDNQLSELPETLFQGLIKLKDLDVTHNRLTRLPATLFECPELHRPRYSDGNQFTPAEQINIRRHLERLDAEQRVRRRRTMWGDQFLE